MKINLSTILSIIVLMINIILSHLFYSEGNEFILSTVLGVIDIIFICIIFSKKT